jgi:hypothetical protein
LFAIGNVLSIEGRLAHTEHFGGIFKTFVGLHEYVIIIPGPRGIGDPSKNRLGGNAFGVIFSNQSGSKTLAVSKAA